MSSVPPYDPEKYITTAEVFKDFGITEEDQKNISAEERSRYQNWTREGNNNVQTALTKFSDTAELEQGSEELTYARDAVLNWVRYKKRDKEGAKNANNARRDFLDKIQGIKDLLSSRPTLKQEPIQIAETTDSVSNYQLGYSQTQGYPEDQLF